jgi:hypothetical protein
MCYNYAPFFQRDIISNLPLHSLKRVYHNHNSVSRTDHTYPLGFILDTGFSFSSQIFFQLHDICGLLTTKLLTDI